MGDNYPVVRKASVLLHTTLRIGAVSYRDIVFPRLVASHGNDSCTLDIRYAF